MLLNCGQRWTRRHFSRRTFSAVLYHDVSRLIAGTTFHSLSLADERHSRRFLIHALTAGAMGILRELSLALDDQVITKQLQPTPGQQAICKKRQWRTDRVTIQNTRPFCLAVRSRLSSELRLECDCPLRGFTLASCHTTPLLVATLLPSERVSRRNMGSL